ncbi:hypothetical protein BC834DRAFT_994497 [Gloeopeniophorella convolvens]|nr:hypothetical protein BC834DRAFT_994497 [Gloeopeniophorella convolvens]
MGDERLILKAWQKVVAIAPWGDFNRQLPEDITIDVTGAESSLMELMNSVCNLLLVPEDIEAVASGTDRMMPISFLARTNMRHLYAYRRFPRRIFHVNTEPSSSSTSAPGLLMLPKLKTIWLGDTSLEDTMCSVSVPVSDAGQLDLWLTTRSEAGMGQVEILVIEEGPSAKSLRNFKRSVSMVATKPRSGGSDPKPFEC